MALVEPTANGSASKLDVPDEFSKVTVKEQHGFGLPSIGPFGKLTKVDTDESMTSRESFTMTPDEPMSTSSISRPPDDEKANGDVKESDTLRVFSSQRPAAVTSRSLTNGLPTLNTQSELQPPHSSPHPHRYSSPPVPSQSLGLSTTSVPTTSASSMRNRHSLLAPKNATPRISREYSIASSMQSEEVGSTTGRFSPTTPAKRRPSFGLARIGSRTHDGVVDEIVQDENAARFAEEVLQKRANRFKFRSEEDDEKVVVGTKVDQHHVNWVTAYNMLTGIRFCVSRTNAKLDRALTEHDFDAKHKFSFDVTGNELTPSARYDFKFKDYAPWVFRHLRAKFSLDPAEYLMSLTSKYILSELGSPGKSGSFFYFSRDYKYIIKTIHHAEHKALRKILKDYYTHVESNPNTLISQFYGLHRVKIPFGRKIHFVVMNNLFPPHRDIHQTFDLKGSTIGRDFREENLEHNPRATLKDLNWLRRDMHLRLGPAKRDTFLAQVDRDVELLKRLKIMDYSLLVGIHDLRKGNEEELRNKTLRIFEPGGEKSEEVQTNALMRTPSKLENARKTRELRKLINSEKPMPIGMSASKMPEVPFDKSNNMFYSDDGGIRATHEDDQPDAVIYYLGIIDCLTHYGIVKKLENFWKGLWHAKSQISPIKPFAYGDRFKAFIRGVTMSAEAERKGKKVEEDTPEEKVINKAERQAEKSEQRGHSEDRSADRVLSSARSPSPDPGSGTILPVVEEVGENSSTGRDDGSDRSERNARTRA